MLNKHDCPVKWIGGEDNYIEEMQTYEKNNIYNPPEPHNCTEEKQTLQHNIYIISPKPFIAQL